MAGNTSPDLAGASYLVVDDDEFAFEVLAGSLATLGAQKVHYAADAAAAERLARQLRPEFVLLDIYMPEQDGWGLLQRLRQSAPQATVLMVTGSSKPADFGRALKELADGYCVKPVLPNVLQQALLAAYKNRHA
jgi:CheY-like chemotaxis protein